MRYYLKRQTLVNNKILELVLVFTNIPFYFFLRFSAHCIKMRKRPMPKLHGYIFHPIPSFRGLSAYWRSRYVAVRRPNIVITRKPLLRRSRVDYVVGCRRLRAFSPFRQKRIFWPCAILSSNYPKTWPFLYIFLMCPKNRNCAFPNNVPSHYYSIFWWLCILPIHFNLRLGRLSV